MIAVAEATAADLAQQARKLRREIARYDHLIDSGETTIYRRYLAFAARLWDERASLLEAQACALREWAILEGERPRIDANGGAA